MPLCPKEFNVSILGTKIFFYITHITAIIKSGHLTLIHSYYLMVYIQILSIVPIMFFVVIFFPV